MVLAYLDPGAGSLFIQALIAGILAVPFFFRTRLAAFAERLRSGRPSSGTSHPREGAEGD
jgi:hypothetical protein